MIKLKRLATAIGKLFTLLSLIFLGFQLTKHFHELPPLQLNLISVVLIVGFILSLVLYFLLLTFAWLLLLRAGNNRVTFLDTYVIFGKSQIGKYLPGNIFHYVSRVTLASKYGIQPNETIVTMGVEAIVIAATGFLLALAGFSQNVAMVEQFHLGVLTPSMGKTVVTIICSIIALAMSVAVFPKMKRWIVVRLVYLHLKRIIMLMVLYAVYFILMGVFLASLLRNLWNVDAQMSLFQLTAGYALAWVLGFIVPGASGGIGIREAVFVSLFGHAMGDGLATGVAIVLRILTSIADLVTFMIAWLLGRSRQLVNGGRSKEV